jgi:opacity protein-like surface antigen
LVATLTKAGQKQKNAKPGTEAQGAWEGGVREATLGKQRWREESMKTLGRLLLLAMMLAPLMLAPLAKAQDGPVFAGTGPRIEAGAGYQFVYTSVPSQSPIAMNGVLLSGNLDLSQRFGIAAELGYARNFDAFNSNHTADLLTYMAGPVFYPLRMRRMNVYTHLLLGGARETGVNTSTDGQLLLGYVNRFAWAAGGGVQYRITQSLGLRVGADYLHTSFFNADIKVQGQSGIQPSASLIYTFGGHRR